MSGDGKHGALLLTNYRDDPSLDGAGEAPAEVTPSIPESDDAELIAVLAAAVAAAETEAPGKSFRVVSFRRV